MTDDQLIERIRIGLNDEVASLHPAADLLERLRSGMATRQRRLSWLPSGFGGALAVAASVAVVGLVVIAIATVGHRGASPGAPSSTPAEARALVARMAVLRRPQTAADRLPASVIAQEASSGGGLPVIPSLTRLAATVDAGPGPLARVEIYVVVGRPRGYPADIVTAVEVAGRPGHRHLLYPANVVDTETAAKTGGPTPSAVSLNGGPAHRAWLDVGVVPDGVTEVKWVYAVGPPVYPDVENNVAVPHAGTHEDLRSATWYGSDRRVVASYDEAAAQRAEAAQALRASARHAIAPALTEHFAIFRRPVPPPANIKRLPERTAVVVARQGYGLNVTQARFVPYPGTRGLWVIPGSSGVSMVRLTARGGGGNNVPISVALSGGMITSSCCTPHGETVWGLVPDGNPAVTAVLADGSRKRVRVIDNVYLVAGKVAAVIVKNPAGHRITVKSPG